MRTFLLLIRRILKFGFTSVLVVGMFLSNMPLGLIELAAQKWQDRNVVDLMWQAQNSRSVVDTFKPQSVLAAQTLIYNALTTTDHGYPGAQFVWTDSNNGYAFFLASSTGLWMASTTDGGTSWSTNGQLRRVDSVNTADVTAHSVWWDGWTGNGATTQYIHIATLDTGVDDTYYTRLDTTTGALSTTVLGTTQGATATAGANYVAITKAEDGVLYMASADQTDSWVVSCSVTCTSAGNWSERVSGWSDRGDDIPLLFPQGGTNNVVLADWDITADTLEYNVYSATSSSWWFSATTTIASSKDDNATYEGQMIGVAHNGKTGKTYLALIDDANDYTTADHDINVFQYATTTGWTTLTNPITTASGGLAGVKIGVDQSTGYLYVGYVRRTTIGTATTGNVYYKSSTDGGTNWGNESAALNTSADNLSHFNVMPVSTNGTSRINAMWKYVSNNDLYTESILAPVVVPPSIKVSGTLYSDEGSSAITTAGIPIKLVVGTGTPGIYSTTTCSGCNGFFEFNSGSILGAQFGQGTPFSVYVNGGNAVKAVAVTRASSTSNGANITGLNLYQNRLIVKHESTSISTSTSNADLGKYDGDQDANIRYWVDGSNNLHVASSTELHVWTGKEFAPGGTVTIHGNAGTNGDGSLHIDDNATTTAGGAITVAGNWTADTGSVFTPHANGLTFNATTSGKTIAGELVGNSALGTTTFNGTNGAWSFSNNASTTGFTITAGTVTAPPLLSVTGSYANSGSFTDNSGTILFSGTSQNISGTLNTATTDFASTTFNGSGTKTISAAASTTSFSIVSGSTVVAPAQLSISGNYSNAGSFTDSGGTVYFNGTTQTIAGTMNTAATDFASTTFLGAGTKTFSNNASTTNFAIESGATVAAPPLLSISGNYTNNGSFTAGTTLYFSGASQTIAGTMNTAATDFSTTTFTGSGTKTFSNNASTTGLTITSGVTVAAPSLLSIAGDYSNSGSFTDNSGTVYFSGTTQAIAGTMDTSATDFANVGFLGSGTKTFSNNASTTNFTIASGVTVSAPSLLSIGGNYSNSGSYGANGGTVLFDGTTQSIAGTMDTSATDFANVGFLGSGTKTFSNNASTTRFTIESGATVVAPPLLSIAGDYSNTGDFTSGSGTVLLDGVSQRTLSGQMTGTADDFNNLTIRNTSGTGGGTQSVVFASSASTTGTFAMVASSSAQFLAGGTYTFPTLSFGGTSAATRTWLRSSSGGSPWNLVSSAGQIVSNVDVADSNACGGSTIDADDGTNFEGSGNTCWDFTLPVLINATGTLYSDEGTTAITTAGKAITLVVATGTPGIYSTTTCSGCGGIFSFLGIDATLFGLGTPLIAFVNGGDSVKAVTVSRASSTAAGANITGLDLYQNRLVIKQEATSGTSTTNTELGKYDADQDPDIRYSVDGSNNLSVASSTELHVASNKVFAPGGTVTVHGNAGSGVDGSVHIDDSATIDSNDSVVTLAGNWALDTGATFTSNGWGTIFSATTSGKTISGTMTGSNSFADVQFNGTNGAWTFNNNASTTSFSINAGSVTAPPLLSVSGDYSNSGTFRSGTSTNAVNFDGTNGYLTRGAGLDGAADSKLWTASFWLRKQGSDGIVERIFSGPVTNTTRIQKGSSNEIRFFGRDTAGAANTLSIDTSANIAEVADGWVHVLASFDMSDPAKRHIYINDVANSPTVTTYADQVIDFTLSDWGVGAQSDGTVKLNGDLADLWVAPGVYLDLSIEANRRKFISSTGRPVYLGVSGQNPTGSSPLVFLSNPTATWQNNLGTGGGFTENGALTDGSGGLTYEGILFFNGTTQAIAGTLNTAATDFDSVEFLGSGTKTISNNASTTNFTIQSGATVVAPSLLTVSGNYSNQGTFTHNSGTVFFANGTTTKTIAGTLTGSSAFNNIVIGPNASTTWGSNAAVANLTITANATTTAPSSLTITGNYSNSGIFNANGGTVVINGSSPQTFSGTMSGTSAFNNLTLTTGSASATTTFAATTTALGTFTATTPDTRVTFLAGATSTLQNISIAGAEGDEVYLWGAGGSLAANTVNFDGSTDYLARGAELTGNADGDAGLISVWVKINGGDGTRMVPFRNASGFFELHRLTTNKFQFRAFNAAAVAILDLTTTGTYTAGSTWLHILGAWDLSAGRGQLYINDADVVDTATDVVTADTIDYTRGDFGVGYRSTALDSFWNGDMADVYVNLTETMDISVEANRRKFISESGGPVYLGTSGQNPTGSSPIVFLSGATDGWETNKGTGGGFTENGALTDGSALGNYTGVQWKLDVPGTRSVSFANIKDSRACSAAGNITAANSTDSGNNTCWNFDAQVEVETLAMTPHILGQVPSAFSDAGSFPNAKLFAFKLVPGPDDEVTVSQLVVGLKDIRGIGQGDITNARLFIDYDGDQVVDAEDLQVGGAGSVSVVGVMGSTTFSTPFNATTTRNYVMKADVANIAGSDKIVLFLNGMGLTATGVASQQTVLVTGAAPSAFHARPGVGGGAAGGGGNIDNTPPPGQGQQEGGSGGGGASLNPAGGFEAPSGTGSPLGEWTNGANAYDSDGSYATAASNGLRQDYASFGFSVPAGNIIDGIEVEIDASASQNGGTIAASLSHNGGTNYTQTDSTNSLTTSDVVYSLGGPSDKWGRTWDPAEFSDGNFRVRLTSTISNNTVNADAIQVRVYHHAGGGGGGGGGEVYAPLPRTLAQCKGDLLCAIQSYFLSFAEYNR